MSTKQIDTVLVDYDGTLMDTYGMVERSWLYTVEKVTGRAPDPEEFRPFYGEPIAETMPRFIPADFPVEEAVRIYREYQRGSYLDWIRPFPGAGETLALLKARGYKLGLPTSRLRYTTVAGLDHFGLTGYFDAILTAEDCEKFKPDPEPLFLILERLGSAPERAVMVGDSAFDLGAARAAGVTAILVDWSAALPAGSARRAAAPAADYVLKAWPDLPDMLY
ncbi:MAG: HAD-IA family hydrolase [Clostridiales Family XIII bacterium]|jgi:pyrophosphatase PpaX|nr:HAD-IA family hydrolase [Clostridiales Family XIII bacterium]